MNAPIITPRLEPPVSDLYADYQLDDRYHRQEGKVLLTGTQALVRLPIDQARLDRQNGLKTAGFISGYRGSPLGGYDQELWRQQKLLDENHIRFQPGINEDLGAAMVWGSQQIDSFPGQRVDGVFGLWYSKGPGLDRSADALRHANAYGTTKLGGVLACVGDDHAAQSSVFPHQTDQIFEALMIPVLSPASVADYLSLGLAGYAMSRFSGLWVGFKSVSEIVESGQSLMLPPTPHFLRPTDIALPPHGFNADPRLAWPQQRAEFERRLVEERLPAAQAFARANHLDRVVYGAERPRFGLVTVGKAHLDAIHALKEMGIDETEARRLGLAVYKLGLIWPVEPEALHRFASGLAGLMVIEEKRGFVERQIKDQLYHLPADRRPDVVGKTLVSGAPLLPENLELSPRQVMRGIALFLQQHDVQHPAIEQVLTKSAPEVETVPGLLTRKPAFCSGCPHNTSTKVPDGSFATAGIGCHIMAMGEARHTQNWSHMGGEGVQWGGLAPFTDMPHLFANMGDGTYQHSGILAIRQAVASRLTMTFKLLFNDAVAMTGGQLPDGHPSVFQVAAQIAAEGVGELLIVSDAPERYDGLGTFPSMAGIHHRSEMDALQVQLRETKGVSVLIYDQTCAAEKRRRRKHAGISASTRAFINEKICEGCGDCHKTSNCIAVEPVETGRGRKRKINQTACNSDLSCVDGFCPSFVTIDHPVLRKTDAPQLDAVEAAHLASLPDPVVTLATDKSYGILITGIGGTGIVTVGSLLAMAAHLEGKAVRCLNFTGLAQKNGAVLSHLQIASQERQLDVPRIQTGELDLLIAYDLAVAASTPVRQLCDKARTATIGTLDLAPTADFVTQPDLRIDADLHRRAIDRRCNTEKSTYHAVSAFAESLFGDTTVAGVMMLGIAYQRGLLPVGRASIDRAIVLNGATIELNRRAFLWGRIAADDPVALAPYLTSHDAVIELPLHDLIEQNKRALEAYQNRAYGQRYQHRLQQVAALESAIFGVDAVDRAESLTRTVAKAYFKLLAYKDEYEVARLHTEAAFDHQLAATFDGKPRLTFHLAPPLLSPIDPLTGYRRKIKIDGRWLLPLLHLLKHGKVLRHTPLDPFGWQADRRLERQLVQDYEADIELICAHLTPATAAIAHELAALPQQVRGFGHVKAAAHRRISSQRDNLRQRLEVPPIQDLSNVKKIAQPTVRPSR
jgi:indolepyruvate ferredoxin oxidoreductase